jgi:tRNA-dihydrouridine synthase A
MKKTINRTISIAPMMACTDRHFRYLARLMSRHVLLYTEMLTTGAVIHGDRDKLLGYNDAEHPIALQLGGSDPKALAQSAAIGADFGYDELNLNVGCPSDRVQAGRFGACLMKEPELVADCVDTMKAVVDIPVTIKMRTGVDDQDSYEALCQFVTTVSKAGCQTFIVHARKAWLKGLSPRENRNVPPLQYDLVYRLKHDFPELEIIINGGVKTMEDTQTQLNHVDGVMIGREAYSNPGLIAQFDALCDSKAPELTDIKAIIKAYLPYAGGQLAKGAKLRSLTRHLVGCFQGEPGARYWRRYLSEHGGGQCVEVIESALKTLISCHA